MNTKHALVAIIGLFLACLSGCAPSATVFQRERMVESERKWSTIVRPASIVRVMLPVSDSSRIVFDSLDTVRPEVDVFVFDSTGGSLDWEHRILRGTLQDGTPFEAAFDDVSYIRVKRTDWPRVYVSIADYSHDREQALKYPIKKVSRGASLYWDVVQFDKRGGYFEAARSTISGTSQKGEPVTVDLDEVHYAQYKSWREFFLFKRKTMFWGMRLTLGAAIVLVFADAIKNNAN